jgi:hypothetical protein
MIPFSAAQPFPLVDCLTDAKTHARKVDDWLGLDTEAIERALILKGCRKPAPASCGERQELWLGLDVQDLLTPYLDLRQLLHELQPKPGETIVDLGAAYGRMAFVLGRHYPGTSFVGYEFVGERIEEGRRALERAGFDTKTGLLRLEHADLASRSFVPQPADIYFLYDYGTMKSVEKTLHDLRKIAATRVCRIVARGRHCRALISARHPWLEASVERGRATIYRTVDRSSATTEQELSF